MLRVAAVSLALAEGVLLNVSASAQIVVPHGDLGDGPEKYLIAAVTFAALCVAAWRFFKTRR